MKLFVLHIWGNEHRQKLEAPDNPAKALDEHSKHRTTMLIEYLTHTGDFARKMELLARLDL
jgi:hypothetical protein